MGNQIAIFFLSLFLKVHGLSDCNYVDGIQKHNSKLDFEVQGLHVFERCSKYILKADSHFQKIQHQKCDCG